MLSENLKRLMNLRGVNQVELAKRAGMSQPAISMILAGKRQPLATQIEKLATALHVTTDELLKGEPPAIPKKVDQLPSDLKELLDLYMALPEGDWRKKAIHEILGIKKQPKKE
ncbi:MAG: helix-turn-helix transcriptional regulator [Candidatus Zixiibacteriota bacterium]